MAASITRHGPVVQLVTMLWRYSGSPRVSGNLGTFPDADKVSDYALDAMSWAVEKGIIEGMNGELRPQANSTRAQVAKILKLMEEVNADRDAHGKAPFDDEDPPKSGDKKRRDSTSRKKLARQKKEKSRTVIKSTTDPDCGLFVKGEHQRQFAYEAHTVYDQHGFVLDTVVTPGNVHDSVAFDDVYDRITEAFPEIETVVADSAHKTPHICKRVFGDGRVLSTAYKRPHAMKRPPWWKYVYDEYFDCVICPEYQVLHYATTNRDGYREYRSDLRVCANCPTRQLCTRSRDCVAAYLEGL